MPQTQQVTGPNFARATSTTTENVLNNGASTRELDRNTGNHMRWGSKRNVGVGARLLSRRKSMPSCSLRTERSYVCVFVRMTSKHVSAKQAEKQTRGAHLLRKESNHDNEAFRRRGSGITSVCLQTTAFGHAHQCAHLDTAFRLDNNVEEAGLCPAQACGARASAKAIPMDGESGAKSL